MFKLTSLNMNGIRSATTKGVEAWLERHAPDCICVQEMKAQHLTKTALAAKMHTSRAALNRLLDEADTSLTLTTLTSAAKALGKNLRIELA